MKTESVIVLPVVARETVYLDWSIYDASGEEIARQILYLKQAHAIARALNTQPQLLEACRAALEIVCDYTQPDGTSDPDSEEVKAQLQSAIAAAEKEKV